MPLVAGSRLDSYEIIAPLGAGGMGEVYRARDATLKRDVAIKVLPENWSRDPERLRRFEQEAQATAALNHANIVSIFHVGQYDGSPYIVTELLQGETLRDRLRNGPMRLQEVLDFGGEIASGLAAAHDAGIVHRDLKPENIWVTKDGRIKILDFGLAKLDPEQAASADGKTVTLRQHSIPGQVLGTVGYMSPEQVRGQPADARSDIFSVGAILYEMLTGQRPFRKSTSAETMTAILNEDPPAVSQVAASVPPGLQRIVTRCLAKSREQRIQHATDLAFALESLSDFGSTTVRPLTGRSASNKSKRTLWVSLAAVIAVGFALAYWWTQPPGAPVVESITQLTDDAKGKTNLQTDGERIYFNEEQSVLGITQVSAAGGAIAAVPSTISPAAVAGIAPDGSSLLILQGAFAVPRPVWELPLPAGEPRRMGNLDAHEASMTRDGRLLLSRVSELFIAEKDGSNPRKIISLTQGHFGDTAMSPDGRRIVFTFYGNPELYIANSDGSGVRPLAKNSERGGFCCARWTADGRFIVFATRFPAPRQDLWYLRMDDGWLQHASEPKRLTAGPLSYWNPVPSQDGKTVFATGTTTRRELIRYDLTSHTFVPLFPGLSVTDLAFSADGQWMAYVSDADHCLWRSRSDGSDRLQLTFPPGVASSPAISPDSKWVVYGSSEGKGSYMVSMDGGTPQKVKNSINRGASLSSDGNFLVFNESTNAWQTPEIKLLDIRTGQVSPVPGGQLWPEWAAPGKFVAGRRDMRVLQIYDVSAGQWSELSKPEDGPVGNWAHSPDFKYFYYTTRGQDPRIICVRMADMKSEVVSSLKNLDASLGGRYTQLSVAPDGSPVLAYEVGKQEIYALTVKWP